MPYDSAAAVGTVLAKAAQNAGGLEHSNQQMGDDASAFDVWTYSYEGMSERMQAFADDPVGALRQYDRDLDAAVQAGIEGDWHSSSFAAVGDSLAAQAEGLGDMVDAIGEAEGALQTVGATFALLTGVEQMLSTLVSVIPFPSLPAIRVTDMDVGLPHAHSHPPNLVPPAPPVPLPSTGPIVPIPILSGAARTLINGMPAARCGDMGLGIWCGGYFPMYEVFLGSSNVWIEGARAGRLAVDITKHCIFTSPKPSDPPIGPMVGVTTTASTNVLIGGVPMPSLLSLAMGAAMKSMMRGLGKVARAAERSTRGLRQGLLRNMKPGFLKCSILRAEPVDVVTGEVVVDQQDFAIPGRIPIEWHRHYGSSSQRRGVCGYGWETPADARLTFEDDGPVIFHDGTAAATVFPAVPLRRAVMELVDGALLERRNDAYVVRTKQRLTYHFPATGSPAREILIGHIEDAFGNTLRFERDGHGLRRIVESAGRTIEVQSADGLVRRMDLANPGEADTHPLVGYQYDDDGNLAAAYDALGSPYRFLHAGHRLIRHTNRNGLSFHYEYDSTVPQGRCVRTWGDGGLYDYRFTFDERQRRTVVVDSLGHVSQVRYDHRYMIIEETDPCGGVTTYEYDEAGRTTARTDARGVRTEWTYDERGCLTSEATGEALKTWAYDEHGRLIEATAGSSAWQLTRGVNGSIDRVTQPNGGVWIFSYTPLGDVAGIADPNGGMSTLQHDAFGRVILEIDPTGAELRLQYDSRGQLAGRGYADEEPLLMYNDDLGLPSICRSANGQYEVRLGYAHSGTPVVALSAPDSRWSTVLTGLDQIETVIEPDGSRSHLVYDTEERLIEVVDRKGRRFVLGRDAAGRIVREIDCWGGVARTSRDPAGYPVCRVNGAGQRREWKRNAIGRVTEDRTETGANEYRYDSAGRLGGAVNANEQVELDWDPEGNLLEERTGAGFVRSEYDRAGNRLSRTWSLGSELSFEYDRNGRVTVLGVAGRRVIQIDRDAAGRIATERLPDGLWRRHHHDGESRPVAVETWLRDSLLRRVEYSWNTEGDLTCRKDSRLGVVNLIYDRSGRQTGWSDAGGRVFTADVEEESNRTPGFGRVARRSNVTFRFDAAGRLIERAGRTKDSFRWDGADRLEEVVGERSVPTRLHHDALGRLVRLERDNDEVRFVWDGLRLLGTVESGHVAGELVFYPGTWIPWCLVRAGQVHLFETDPVGLPLRLYDEVGNIVWEATYDGWGRIVGVRGTNQTVRLRFPGQVAIDEIGLHYSLNRYYDPVLGEFVSCDPLGIQSVDDLHEYAPNVWSWMDPFGTDCKSAFKRWALRQIRNDRTHPLRFLLSGRGRRMRFRRPPNRGHHNLANGPYVEMGHLESNWVGGTERMALQDAWGNQLDNLTVERSSIGGFMERDAVDIGGVPVERRTAEMWERTGLLPEGTVTNSPSHPGWQRP